MVLRAANARSSPPRFLPLFLLALAACGRHQGGAPAPASRHTLLQEGTAPAEAVFGCPMDCEAPRSEPGRCAACGMQLVARHGAGAYVCLEHLDSVALEPGACAQCGAPRSAASAAAVWRCPRHAELALEERGECPICTRALVSMTVALVWSCGAHDITRLEEGACPTCGSALERICLPLPHGDHNPKHGGVFFMAPDLWHHLEGTLPEEGRFRLYLYDDFTRPLAAAGFEGRIRLSSAGEHGVVDEQADATPLLPAAGGEYLEARVEPFALPLELTAWVRLGGREERFDFRFGALSTPPGGEPPQDGAAARSSASGPEIPESAAGIVAEILIRDLRLRLLIHEAAWTKLYVPAFEAKELALALEERFPDLSPERRGALSRAVKDIVRGAWLLDSRGDLGDREGALEAYGTFSAGVEALRELFALFR
jgi:ribosomal protein L37AE/L43A